MTARTRAAMKTQSTSLIDKTGSGGTSGADIESLQHDLADSATFPEDLADVATSGAYADLTGTPTIPNGDLAALDTVGAAQIDAEAITEAKLDALDTPADGEVLAYDSGTGRLEWVAQSGGAVALADLTDVDATVGSPSDGDILVYRSAGTDWVLEPKPAAGSNPAIGDISDWPAGVDATEVGYLDGVTSAIQTQLDAKQQAAQIFDDLAGLSLSWGDILFYTDGALTKLAAADTPGKVLASGGADADPSWTTAGAGDVSKVGTPVAGQVGVWTGSGTIEGTGQFTYSSGQFKLVPSGTTLHGSWSGGTAGFFGQANHQNVIYGNASSTQDQTTTFYTQRSRGTLDAPTAVQAGDDVIKLLGGAHDGTSIIGGARILSEVVGTVTTGSVGQSIRFQTGTSFATLTTRLNIGCPLSTVPNAITFNEAYTFPTSIGTSGQVLKVPASGTLLEWAAESGGVDWSDQVNADILPDANNTRDIGSDAARFAEGHFQTLYVGGAQVLSVPDPDFDALYAWDDSAGQTVPVAIGSGLSFDGTTLTATGGGVSDGDKGDITVSGSGATWTIDNSAVTLAKMADLAQNTIIGRVTASTGVPEALTGANVRTIAGLATSDSPQFTAINLGHASDTTLARSAAGQVTIEGVQALTASNTVTVTSKTIDANNNTISNLEIGAEVSGTLQGNLTLNGFGLVHGILTDASGTRTLALTDRYKIVRVTHATANAVTIPDNATTAFSVGTMILVRRATTGTCTITAAAGVTLNGVTAGSCTIQTAHRGATLMKVGTDSWEIDGDNTNVA